MDRKPTMPETTDVKSRRSLPLGRRYMVLIVAFVVLASGVSVAYALDSNRKSTLADGLTVAGVPVGGLNSKEATAKLERKLPNRNLQPIIVTHKDETFRLNPQYVEMRIEIKEAVRRALDRSRKGGIIGRTLRRLTGDKLDTDIKPKVHYSRAGVRRWVKEVNQKIHVNPVSARLKFKDGKLKKVRHKNGTRLNTNSLVKDVEARLGSISVNRVIEAQTRVHKPKITTSQLASAYPRVITVNRSAYKVVLWKNLEKALTFRIAIGRAGQDSPGGRFSIINKAVNPAWYVPDEDWAPEKLRGKVVPGGAENNPLKARWLGVTYDGVGFHGTDDEASIGTSASAGCFRMLIPDIKVLYKQIKVNTPVFIS